MFHHFASVLPFTFKCQSDSSSTGATPWDLHFAIADLSNLLDSCVTLGLFNDTASTKQMRSGTPVRGQAVQSGFINYIWRLLNRSSTSLPILSTTGILPTIPFHRTAKLTPARPSLPLTPLSRFCHLSRRSRLFLATMTSVTHPT